MRTIVSHTFMTLDGVAAPAGAAMDTIVALRGSDEVLGDFNARVAEEDAMLLGRVTYEEWADYWPTSTIEPFAGHINTVPKFVASRSLREAPWSEHDSATILDGELTEAVAALKAQPGKNIGVHGSLSLVETLLHADLLDELRLEIFPVIAGTGARLFNAERALTRLRVSASRITSNGVAILTYARAAA